MEKSVHGFTLVELLVVIAIMSIVGVFTLSNFKSFGEDQNLKSAVLDIQSLLRQAQTNAVTNAICQDKFGASWQVFFRNSTNIDLNCTEPGASTTLKKTLQLPANIAIQSNDDSAQVCRRVPVTVNLSLLTGVIDIEGTCAQAIITLRNSQTQATKDLIIEEQGGRIYAW